jgi:hypothetical protein
LFPADSVAKRYFLGRIIASIWPKRGTSGTTG